MMELQLPSTSVLLSFILFIFMLVKTVKRANDKSKAPKLPPGPWQLPLIGNIHELLVGSSLTHRTFRKLARKYGPLMHLQLGEVSTIIVSSPEIAKEIMKTHDIVFAQRPFILAARILAYGPTNILFSPYGDYWRQLRKICVVELLSTRRVQTFRAIREEEVSNLIKSISSKAGSPINLSKEIFSLTNAITARAAFGSKREDQETFISTMEEASALATGFSIVDMYPSVKLFQVISGIVPKLEEIHKRIDQILESIVKEHRDRETRTETGKGEAEDLVDVLLRIQKHGELEFPLIDDNIKAVILDIFTAGSTTSSTTVEWAMSEMMKNPRVMTRAQAEVRQAFREKGNADETGLRDLNYLNSVIKETLRLHPPAPLLFPRECREKCIINGYEIPVKTSVIVNAWAIGRDPSCWIQAEKFEPDRFLKSTAIDFKGANFEYIPFGAGRRICPGISFALPNIELPLAQLLYHFDWELSNGMKLEELDMTEISGATVGRKNNLRLIPIPYHPPPVK